MNPDCGYRSIKGGKRRLTTLLLAFHSRSVYSSRLRYCFEGKGERIRNKRDLEITFVLSPFPINLLPFSFNLLTLITLKQANARMKRFIPGLIVIAVFALFLTSLCGCFKRDL